MARCLSVSSLGRWGFCLPRPRAAAASMGRAVGSTASDPEATSHGNVQREEDLPCVNTLTMLYMMFFKGYYQRVHELQVYERQLYGPMYKLNAGNLKFVMLSSAELIQELLRKDDKYPSRADMSAWTDYRDMKGLGYGPLTENGEKWYRLRSVLNKRMLHPKDSLLYGDGINEVVTDFVKRIYHLRQSSPTGDMVPNLSNELYRFTLEAISLILFETRIGCLEKEIPKDTQDFIDSVAQMFSSMVMVAFLPKWSRNLLPFWGRCTAGWDGIFKFSRKLIDMKMDVIQQQLKKGEQIQGEYLTYLLSSNKMDIKDVYGNIAELLLAGVDTTSNTMVWTLYLLSKNLEEQKTLFREVSSTVPGDSIPTAQNVLSMPYLKAVIKESLRMFPVVTANARTITERSVTIGGLLFPKNTTFSICHYAINYDPAIFPEPHRFRPERWLRNSESWALPFSSIPFGFGVRSCVGRRIAELEMYLALSRIIKQFEVHPDPRMGEVKARHRLTLVPDREIMLHFLDRNGSSTP